MDNCIIVTREERTVVHHGTHFPFGGANTNKNIRLGDFQIQSRKPSAILYISKKSTFSDIIPESTPSELLSFSAQNRPFVISTNTTNAHEVKSGRTSDLLDRPRKPLAGAEGPEPKRVGKDDSDGDGRVVECLRADRVELREAEGDRDKADPEHGGDRYWV
jgi:hypothetical protein